MAKCKAEGGSTQVVSGNKRVIEEAEEDKTGDSDKTGEHKRGGKVAKKRKKGGKVIGLMTGGPVRQRMDRPGRKRGGGVGANTTPLSTAFRAANQDAGSSNPKDTYGGMKNRDEEHVKG